MEIIELSYIFMPEFEYVVILSHAILNGSDFWPVKAQSILKLYQSFI